MVVHICQRKKQNECVKLLYIMIWMKKKQKTIQKRATIIYILTNPLAILPARFISSPAKSKKLLSISPSVESKKARYPMTPHAISNTTHSESARAVALPQRAFVGRSNEPATMNALC